MPITITAEQRDALYGQVLDHLSGIGDLCLVIDRGDYETAERIGREFDDDLRLVLDDLGWGDETDRSVELTMSPEDLRRVLSQLRERAQRQQAAESEELEEYRVTWSRAQRAVETCDQVLDALGGSAVHSSPDDGHLRDSAGVARPS